MPIAEAPKRRRIAFIFAGGIHQALHIAPAAVALRATADVTAFVMNKTQQDALAGLLSRLGAPDIPVSVMQLGFGGSLALKVPRLLRWWRALRRFDALVTAERTTTILKRLPGAAQPIIHIPHGVGDRAKGFEPRIALFDHVIVAGDKDRRRLLAEGLVSPERCDVSGSIKLAAVDRIAGPPLRLFDDDRPVILYNPHFDRRLSSWLWADDLVQRIADEGRFNLIVAPHVRLDERLSRAERARWRDLSLPGRVLVDLGSERSIDMSYTRAADIYLGDVSSQVYEFIATPRPCVFVNAHEVQWADDPSYAMWRFGAVAEDVDQAVAELGRAFDRHPEFVDVQRTAAIDALGTTGADAPAIAARQIQAAVERLVHTEL